MGKKLVKDSKRLSNITVANTFYENRQKLEELK